MKRESSLTPNIIISRKEEGKTYDRETSLTSNLSRTCILTYLGGYNRKGSRTRL